MRAALLPLVLLVVSVQGQQSTNPRVGQPCTPSYVPRCGNATILNETTGQSSQYGPNVCQKETLMRVQVYSYVYRQSCYNHWRGGRNCRLTCYCTNRCDAVRVTTIRRLHCCEGFTTKMYPSQYTIRRDGCPMKLEDTVLDCLDRLNRTMLLDDDSLDSIESRLDDSSVETTLFIPNETALMNTEVDNETIASHLATGSFRAERLFVRRLTTAADGHFIHITAVYPRRYYWRRRFFSRRLYRRQRLRLFANGVEITGANACFAKNGVVHEIDGVIMSSSRTTLQVLDNTPELSLFKELINKAGLNKSLSSEYSKTVFALSNGAIDDNTMTCLCRPENRNLLRSFVEFYIVPGAEYNSTIRLRNKLYPLVGRISIPILPIYRRGRCSILVKVNGSDTIVGGSRIVDADIPASNGVIHILSRPMNNPILNLSAQCPPPTAPPSTTASSSSPTTVSESPSATRPPDETISRPTLPPTRPPDEA